jgi:peroxiredoxin
MKKLIMVASVATLLFACNKDHDGYHISGTIDGVEDGKKILIQKQNEVGMTFVIDSAFVKNGKFEFEGIAEDIEIVTFQIDQIQGFVPFVLENEKMNAVIYKDSLNASKVTGSYNNDELIRYNKEVQGLYDAIQKFEMENSQAYTDAKAANDTETMDRLLNERKALIQKPNDYNEKYIAENNKSYISVLLLQGMLNNPEADYGKVKTYYDALSPEIKATKVGKTLLETLNKVSAVSVGQIAPDFSAPNPEGQMVSLKESLGKITLIDFWASWCKPCRIENPNVVALYNEFHDKGLNIIGVSLDREDSHDKWTEAIATDNLTWTQVSNLKFWQDPVARLYNIQSIPATFLLDENGRIIAKDLRGEELRNKVAELLGE